MRVTDPQRASSAAQLLVTAFVADAVLLLLSFAVNSFVPQAWDGPWPLVEELLFTLTSVVTTVALVRLNASLEDRSLGNALIVVWIATVLLDLVSAVLFRDWFGHAGSLPSFARVFETAVVDLSLLTNLAARGLLFVFMFRLVGTERAWVVPLFALSFLLAVARSGLSLALTHGMSVRELITHAAYRYASMGASLFGIGVLILGAWNVKQVVESAQPANTEHGRHPALGPAQPVSPASAGADFAIGAVLLVVGLGVTAISLQAASNGGRYVVATGAIGVGLGRIIRGFIRLSKGGAS